MFIFPVVSLTSLTLLHRLSLSIFSPLSSTSLYLLSSVIYLSLMRAGSLPDQINRLCCLPPAVPARASVTQWGELGNIPLRRSASEPASRCVTSPPDLINTCPYWSTSPVSLLLLTAISPSISLSLSLSLPTLNKTWLQLENVITGESVEIWIVPMFAEQSEKVFPSAAVTVTHF